MDGWPSPVEGWGRMTVHEAIIIGLSSNLVLIGVFTVVLMIVKQKSIIPFPVFLFPMTRNDGYLSLADKKFKTFFTA